MGKAVYAIDFGTSNSLLAAAKDGRSLGFAPLDPGAAQPAVLRSLLYFPSSKSVFYGSDAVREFAARDQVGRLIRSIKRQLPRRSFVGTYVDDRPFNLEDLIAVFLGEMKRRANAFFGEDATAVVLGRPARFSDDDAEDRFAQDRLERAARLAGFAEVEFFAEPIAAAHGYAKGLARERGVEETVFAADFGGGTSDFTLYRVRPGSRSFESSDVIAMGGVAIAGDALDSAIMRRKVAPYFGTGVRYQVPFGSNVLTMPTYLMERICHPAEISLLSRRDTYEFLKNVQEWSLGKEDRIKMERLFTLLNDQLGFPVFERIEALKRAISDAEEGVFEFRYPSIEIRETLTRPEFEKEVAHESLHAIVRAIDETLAAAGCALSTSKVDRVLCTGGTAKVPFLREELVKRFGPEKLHDLDPFLGVAQGLLSRAEELSRG